MLIVDAHLDLAWNALDWNRDLSLPVGDIRRREGKFRLLLGFGHRSHPPRA